MTMSRTLSLEPCCTFHLKWKKQFSFPRTHTFTTSISIPNNIKSHNNAAIKLKFKCHLNQNHNSNSKPKPKPKPKPLLESLASTIWNTLRKPVVAAMILLIGILLTKSSSSPSSSAPSPSFSASSSSSRSYSAPSSSSSSSWSRRSYSRVPSPPSPEFSYSAEPSPFRVERAVGAEVDSSDFNFFISILAGFSPLFFVFVFLPLIFCFLFDRDDGSVLTNTAAGKTTVLKLQQNQAISDRDEGRSVLTAAGITTVLKLQVGLLGTGRSLQRDLNRIAEIADTSSPEGLNYILTETSLALIRHPDYCISGYSSVDIKQGIEEGEERFNQLSIEERGKFDEETLVNVDNIKRQSTRSQRSNGFSNEYIVITILAAAEGEHKLPSINGSGKLKEALQKLGSIPSSKLLAVEVLWTPQDENDTLSERELREDYPLLQPL